MADEKKSRGAIKPNRTTSLGWITTQIRYLEGEILTLIDASYAEEAQRKAVKDLTKTAFRRKMDWIDELASKKIGKTIVSGTEV